MVQRPPAAPGPAPASPPPSLGLRLRRFWQPPVFADDEKTRAARTLHPLLLNSFVAILLVNAVGLVFFPAWEAGLLLSLAIVAPLAIAYVLLRRGQVRAASWVTVTGLWVISTLLIGLAGGVNSVAAVYYLTCTTFAGLLLGSRAARITAAASALAGLGFALLPTAGYPLPRLFPMPFLSGWLNLAFGLYIITVTLNVTLKNLREALDAARQQLAKRREAEAALRDSERQFRDIARNLPGMVFQYRVPLAGGAGHFSYASPRASELFGLPVNLPGQDWGLGRAIHPDDFPAFSASVDRAQAIRANWSFEGRLRLPSGGFKWIQAMASPTVAGNELVFNGIVLDVSERKQAEADLRESEARFRLLVDESPNAISVHQDGRLIFVNPAALQLLGARQETDLLGRPIADFIHPDQRPAAQARFQRLLAGETGLFPVEDRYVRLDGSPVPVELIAVPLLHAGRPAVQVIAVDITERQRAAQLIQQQNQQLQLQNQELRTQGQLLRQAEADLRRLNTELEQRVTARTAELSARTAELNQANAALARAARLKDEFLAGMSHELRTPLTAILGLSEALQVNPDEPPSEGQFQMLQTIRDSGEHLLALITDILDLSKVEAGKMELALGPLLVDDLCQTSLQMVRQAAHKKALRVSYNRDLAVTRLTADERRLKQMLVNLLINAVKFTPGGGALGLDVQGDAARQEVRFTVWDTGPGIAPGDQARLFQPFVQLDSEQAGTGLGLSLVARMASLHGGRTTLESTGVPGEGSRFSVFLPWRIPTATGFLRGAAQTRRPALIVSGSHSLTQQLHHYLADLGRTAVDYPQAAGLLDQVTRQQPEVILLDVRLPDRSGWDVLAELRADPHARTIPVIATSPSPDAERARAARASGLLVEPIALADLQRALEAGCPPAEARPATPSSAAPLILLADDNDVNLSTLQRLLHSLGYQVAVARNGREALAQAQALHPALIVMDIQMPELSGLEATRALRADPNVALAATPIIALTALAMPGDRERCLEAGAQDYLTKPVNLARLRQTIEAQLPVAARPVAKR